jgi:hypothetical protein
MRSGRYATDATMAEKLLETKEATDENADCG